MVEDGNKHYDSRDHCNAIVETATNKLLRACVNSTIPYGIEVIGKEAFTSLHQLASVNIPSSVTSIEDYAFEYCRSLTSVTIPSSVTSIGINPFCDCSSLQALVVDEGNKWYDSRNGCNAIIETATGRLVAGCDVSNIPHGVTAIGESALEGCSISSIDIPSSVTSIERFAFVLSELTSVDIPSSVKFIGENAFSNCHFLNNVIIRSGAISMEERAFAYNSLKDVYIYGTEMPECSLDDQIFYYAISEESNALTLHVDASLVDKYKGTSPWTDWFTDIVALNKETGIENVDANTNTMETYSVYSVDGKSLPTMQKGINILRSKTGKNVKVFK